MLVVVFVCLEAGCLATPLIQQGLAPGSTAHAGSLLLIHGADFCLLCPSLHGLDSAKTFVLCQQ